MVADTVVVADTAMMTCTVVAGTEIAVETLVEADTVVAGTLVVAGTVIAGMAMFAENAVEEHTVLDGTEEIVVVLEDKKIALVAEENVQAEEVAASIEEIEVRDSLE